MVNARELLADDLSSLESVAIADVLDTAFARLVRTYPVEYVFKTCALDRLLFGRHSPRTTAFYSEFPVGNSRADLLVVNGEAHVFEIKTQYDDLSRLDAQLADYYRAFTHVTLFVSEERADEVLKTAPASTGVTVLSRKYSMSVARPASRHSESLDGRSLFRLFHADEYLPLLRSRGIDMSTVDRAVRYIECAEAFEGLDPEELHADVATCLKRRQRTEQLAHIAVTLPRSLRLAPFAYRKSKADWRALSLRMHEPA